MIELVTRYVSIHIQTLSPYRHPVTEFLGGLSSPRVVMAEGQLYFIRHATSTYNVASREHVSQYGTRKHMPLKWDSRYVDCELSPEGVRETQEAKANIQGLSIDKILVSPFKRALQTCELLFGDMPNRPIIKVCPLIAEKCGNAPDLSTFYGTPFPEYAHYDWSALSGVERYWLLDNVQNDCTREIASRAQSQQQAQELMLEEMRRRYPEKVETKEDIFRRAEKARDLLKEELRTGNVAIVTHSNFTKHFTLHVLGTAQWLENCGVLRVSLV